MFNSIVFCSIFLGYYYYYSKLLDTKKSENNLLPNENEVMITINDKNIDNNNKEDLHADDDYNEKKKFNFINYENITNEDDYDKLSDQREQSTVNVYYDFEVISKSDLDE